MKKARSHAPFFHALLRGSVLWFGASVLVLWAWNSFAPYLLALEPMRFKQALGVTVFVTVVARLAMPQGHMDCRNAAANRQCPRCQTAAAPAERPSVA